MDGTSSKLKLTGRGNRNKATWVVEQLKKLQKKVVALIKGELQERLGVPPVALYLKTILDVRTMPFIRTIESQDADTSEASKAKMKTQAVVAVDWVAKNVMKHLDPAVTKPEVVRYYKWVASKWDEFEDLDKETGKRKFNIARLFEYITAQGGHGQGLEAPGQGGCTPQPHADRGRAVKVGGCWPRGGGGPGGGVGNVAMGGKVDC